MEWLFHCLAGVASLLGLTACTAAIILAVRGLITRSGIAREMRSRGIQRVVATMVDRCQNIVRLKDLEAGQVMEMRGDGIESDLAEGDMIIS